MKIFKRISVLAILAALFSQTASAIPAYGQIISYRQPDGTIVEVRLVGDEHCHAYYSLDGQLLQPDENQMLRPVGKVDFDAYYSRQMQQVGLPRKALNIGSDGRTNFPTQGKLKGIILLVEFSDRSFTEGYDQSLFNDLANGEDFTYDGATGSIAKYFQDQSYGKFQPEFDVVGPVKLTSKLSHYGQNDSYGNDVYAYQMVSEAVQQADTLYNIDFSKYDNDGDGNVDFVYCIYAGYGESYGAPAYTIWPHQSTLSSSNATVQLDGVTIDRYACSCELKYTAGSTLEGIGTFCHEFGHVLGLPDLYQTNGGSGVPCGQWDVMDRGSYNNSSKTPPAYSAYERWCLKWLELTDLEEPKQDVELPCLADTAVAYRLVSPNNSNEYFLLENRQQRGWDAPQAASGLLIYHVDYMESSWNSNMVNNNSSHYRCAIVPADNAYGTNTYAGDVFPGENGKKTSFTDDTTPSSLLFDGTRLGKPVTSISQSNGIVTFSVLQSKLLPPEIIGTDTTSTSLTAHWNAVKGAQSYKLTVNQVLSEEQNPTPISDDFSAMENGSYAAALEDNDLADSLDIYMNERGWTGSNVYDAGGYVQIGRYGVGGQLTTPSINLSGNDGTFTVKYTVRAYANRSMNYNLIVADSLTGEQLSKERFKLTSTPTVVYRVFHCGTTKTTLSFTTTNERLFIDELKVARGEVDSLAMDTIQSPQWIIENIKDTSYTLDGLTPGSTYSYFVQAISGDVLYDSKASETITVTLPGQPSAITVIEHASDGEVDVFNLAGQKVYHGSSIQSAGLPQGIYVVCSNGMSRKIYLRH